MIKKSYPPKKTYWWKLRYRHMVFNSDIIRRLQLRSNILWHTIMSHHKFWHENRIRRAFSTIGLLSPRRSSTVDSQRQFKNASWETLDWILQKILSTRQIHPTLSSPSNPAERAMAIFKDKINRVLIATWADPRAWFCAARHVADICNHMAHEKLE